MSGMPDQSPGQGENVVTVCRLERNTYTIRWMDVPVDDPDQSYAKAHASATMTRTQFRNGHVTGLTALRYGIAERHALCVAAAAEGIDELIWVHRTAGSNKARVVFLDVATEKSRVLHMVDGEIDTQIVELGMLPEDGR